MSKKCLWKHLYNIMELRLGSANSIFSFARSRANAVQVKENVIKKWLDVCSDLIFAVYKKLTFKDFLCCMFQDGLLYSPEFIQCLLSLRMPYNSWLSLHVFSSAIRLIQIHKFHGFCDETYYLNVFLKIKLPMGKLISTSLNSCYLYFPVK